jgi:hypothetical protein
VIAGFKRNDVAFKKDEEDGRWSSFGEGSLVAQFWIC